MLGAFADQFQRLAGLETGLDGEIEAFPGGLTSGGDKGFSTGVFHRFLTFLIGVVAKVFHSYWGVDNGCFPAVVFLDLSSGITRDSDDLVWLPSGAVVGFAERLHEEF